jgi:hypothetical protein
MTASVSANDRNPKMFGGPFAFVPPRMKILDSNEVILPGGTVDRAEVQAEFDRMYKGRWLYIWIPRELQYRFAAVLRAWEELPQALFILVHYIGYDANHDEQINLFHLYHQLRRVPDIVSSASQKEMIQELWPSGASIWSLHDGADVGLERFEKKEGDRWNLIDAGWWTVWRMFTGFGMSSDCVSRIDTPPPAITNESLLRSGPIKERLFSHCLQAFDELAPDSSNSLTLSTDLIAMLMDYLLPAFDPTQETAPLLRFNLVPNRDFYWIPHSVWNALYDWYGGGPSIERTVWNTKENGLAVTLHHSFVSLYGVSATVTSSHFHHSNDTIVQQLGVEPIDRAQSLESLARYKLPVMAPHLADCQYNSLLQVVRIFYRSAQDHRRHSNVQGKTGCLSHSLEHNQQHHDRWIEIHNTQFALPLSALLNTALRKRPQNTQRLRADGCVQVNATNSQFYHSSVAHLNATGNTVSLRSSCRAPLRSDPGSPVMDLLLEYRTPLFEWTLYPKDKRFTFVQPYRSFQAVNPAEVVSGKSFLRRRWWDFRVDDVVDARDRVKRWYRARIMSISTPVSDHLPPNQTRLLYLHVHFLNWPAGEYDEVVEFYAPFSARAAARTSVSASAADDAAETVPMDSKTAAASDTLNLGLACAPLGAKTAGIYIPPAGALAVAEPYRHTIELYEAMNQSMLDDSDDFPPLQS